MSWETVGGVIRATAEQARFDDVVAVDCQEAALGCDVRVYRQVL